MRRLTVIQAVPAMHGGGVERGTVEIGAALAARGHRPIVVSGGGAMVAALREVGCEHITLDIGKKSLTSFKHIRALAALFRAQQADIVHARSRLPAWLCYLALKQLPPATRPRFVTTVHGPYSVNAYSRIMTRGEKVIAVSAFIRDYILQNYPQVRPQDIHHIPRGVSAAEFPYGHQADAAWREGFAQEFPQTKGRRLLTLPARLSRWKGQLDFLRVLAGILDRRQDVHGLLVGAAAPRRARYARELQQQARALGLAEHLTFTGHRHDLREIMAASTLIYSLARIPEAFGRTALEALSLGRPVVAYDHGGASEVLGKIYPPGLIPPGDQQQALKTSLALLDKPVTVPENHSFTLEAMQEGTMGVYESL